MFQNPIYIWIQGWLGAVDFDSHCSLQSNSTLLIVYDTSKVMF